MPIYRTRCDACGHEADIFRSVAEYDNLPEHCGVKMRRVICAPIVIPDTPAYESPITGKLIEGRAARRDDLARHGCRPWEGMEAEMKEAAKARAEADKKLEQYIDVAVEKVAPHFGLGA